MSDTKQSETIHSDRSTEIGKLALALSQAQGEITGARKDSKNPFFKTNYADLASCWDACREPLAKHKLAVIQTTNNNADGVVIITTLVHESNQWIRGELTVKPAKADPQGLGSAITYGRRYALSAMVGIAQVDDDANDATGNGRENKQNNAQTKTSADFEILLEKATTVAELDEISEKIKPAVNKFLSPQEGKKLYGFYIDLKAIMAGTEKDSKLKLNV